MRPDFDKERSAVWVALAVEAAVLAVTGVALLFLYRPAGVANFDGGNGGAGASEALQVVHRLASWLMVPTALGAATMALLARVSRRWVVAGGVALAAVAASITGFLLPWEQVAIFAVTVGGDFRGYWRILDEDVRFVLIGGSEVSKATLLRYLALHVALGAALAASAAVALRRRLVRSRVEIA